MCRITRRSVFEHTQNAQIQKSLCSVSAQSRWSLHCPFITKTCIYNFDPLKSHFYIVKLRFTGVCIIVLISAQNIDCMYLLEPPRRGGSNEYPQSIFWTEIWKKKYLNFLSENFHFLVVKFSMYLNRHDFVMDTFSSIQWTCKQRVNGMRRLNKALPVYIYWNTPFCLARPDKNRHCELFMPLSGRDAS